MLLKAGMPLEEGLLIMVEDEKSSYGKSFLKDIYDSVSEGSTFHSALVESEGFPSYVTDMVLIGEKTGKLEDILHELNLYYESKEELTSNIKSAVVYPFIMAIMMTIVLLVLALKVLPMFTQVYYELGSGVPASVLVITQIGKVVSIVFAIILGIAIFIFVFAMLYNKKKKNKIDLQNIILEKSKIGDLVARARFASVMSLAFSSGLEIEYAMDLAERLVQNSTMQEKIHNCKEMLEIGKSFSDALLQTEIFDGMNAGLISTGVRSGSTEDVMQFVAKRYTKEAERKIAEAVSIVEPALVITMSVLVGMMLLILMMPLLGIMSAMG